jgi:proteasome lid subunit RPN8/RPN11
LSSIPTLLLSPSVNARLARLCDALHPHEIGGFLLGTVDVNYSAIDIFPVINTSQDSTRQFQEHPWGKSWVQLYSKMAGIRSIARFHSHPNGAIVSERDVRACGRELHLWIIHHGLGKHTYVAALNLRHVEVAVQTTQMEAKRVMLMEDRLHLGDVSLTKSGGLEAAPLADRLLRLDEKSRRAYMAALTAPPNPRRVDNFVTYAELAVMVSSTPSTVREWMKPCIKQGLAIGLHGGVKTIHITS